jgi:glycosyltransferase involved in cell wall biosynthesis
MDRYARLLEGALRHTGIEVTLVHPAVRMGQLSGMMRRAQNALFYIDKFVLFPRRLASLKRLMEREGAGRVLVHVLDQGNALYSSCFNQGEYLNTCHDVIAAKAALRQPSSSRSLGRWFHARNLRMLQGAGTVVCDSDKTLQDCQSLFREREPRPRLTRVYVPLDPCFLDPTAATQDKRQPPFLLHVGNSAWYKNRPGLFRIYAALRQRMPGAPDLHLYGEPLQPGEAELLEALGLTNHVTCHARPTTEAIRQAYQSATALIFPSLEEGFGWPPLEAMACGCPVFTSNRAPLTEICGGAAEYIDPEKPEEAATRIAGRLGQGAEWRAGRVQAGKERAALFNMETFTAEMLQVYEGALALAPSRDA